ncbi:MULTISPECIES: TetR/AcrR family transcriptional regulator [unclassified Microbacterium]|uniref:TetR/AcrR family transcriptional regulator n=1 Tax=unclassified Microbacterium TaxID=2609290 RepID=UPI00214CE8D3|nr:MULTISPECIES: TetR/AcrR family transcriptional regulator [unclassified Microbacterium]MCR2784837.1 TetR/AcrR family transcriptional regulator [Microbacterium sp. zg.B96]MDL5352710.1 TetR/AcrR family transcriptional regulator [Microbacterium sp. zg-YB36]WIM16375.1 TetR/AcrR family transcriptional regulator [Microbacterium sp. zg-B96]
MDPRVARTRASLQDALVELARERSLDATTIGDIVQRAGVNRSSFYQHYPDKETLLADALERALDEVAEPLRAAPRDGALPAMPRELLQYLEHIAANAALYRRVLGDHGSALVAARLRARIELTVRDTVGLAHPDVFADLPIDVVGAGIAGTALGVITAWVSRDPLPPVEMAAYWLWRVLVGPGLSWPTAP